MDCAFNAKSLPGLISQWFSPIFLLRVLEFYILYLSLLSFFELIFVPEWHYFAVHFLPIATQLLQQHCWKGFRGIVFAPLSKPVGHICMVLSTVPLMYVCVHHSSTPYSFDDCTYGISLKIWWADSSHFIVLGQNCLAILVPLHFHTAFRIILSIAPNNKSC